jgi:hypothetical protein
VLHVFLHLFVIELAANQTLESEDGILRVHDCLSLGREANETFAMLGERDDGGSCPCTFRVLDDAGSLTLHDGDARVGRPQVDTDDRTCIIVSAAGKRHDTYAYPKPSSSYSSRSWNGEGPCKE